MLIRFFTLSLTLGSLLSISSSCIPQKKVWALEDGYRVQLDSLAERLVGARSEIAQQELLLAERKGENTALLATQDMFMNRIDALQEEIERLQRQSSNEQTSLSQQIRSRDSLIAARESQLQALRDFWDRQREQLQQIAAILTDSLRSFPTGQVRVDANSAQITIQVAESLLFRPGVTNKIEDKGIPVLAKISGVLGRYPTLSIDVVGNTDNQPQGRRSVDNWDFGALRANTVVRSITRDYGLSTSRVLAGSKGEFAPTASNETEEGRTRNRRIEFIIAPRLDDLLRDSRRLLTR
ncbi:MAG: OmpA family protein [Lewinellaceae bacterium]|nr:OmpA family protein [Lewinellaceae bacterium]